MYNIKKISGYKNIDELLKILEKYKKPKIFLKGTYIFNQGEKPNNFYFLKSGATKTFSTSKDGNEKTIFILRTKGIFAASSFFSGDIRRSSCIAIKDSEIIVIDKNLVNSIIMKEPNLALNIIKDMSRDINLMIDDISSTNFLSANEQVAEFIYKCISANHFFIKDNLIHIDYTQEELSKILGLSRPTINKSLNKMKSQGLIDTCYKSIAILDYNRIRSYVKRFYEI